jgi:hypothetical protein
MNGYIADELTEREIWFITCFRALDMEAQQVINDVMDGEPVDIDGLSYRVKESLKSFYTALSSKPFD